MSDTRTVFDLAVRNLDTGNGHAHFRSVRAVVDAGLAELAGSLHDPALSQPPKQHQVTKVRRRRVAAVGR